MEENKLVLWCILQKLNSTISILDIQKTLPSTPSISGRLSTSPSKRTQFIRRMVKWFLITVRAHSKRENVLKEFMNLEYM